MGKVCLGGEEAAMTVKIVTDSTCDLPAKLIAERNITVIPCYINLNGKSYLDGAELTRQDFYRMLPESTPHPTTSAPGTGAFIAEYQRLKESGADGIVSIHISKNLSNVCNVAQLAAQEVTGLPITVIDSGQLTLGLGLLVNEAAKIANAGGSLAEIERALQNLIPRTYAYARLDTLEYLRRSGRLSNIQHRLASLLNIKPIMKMNRGSAQMEAVRTKKRAHERLVELVQALGPLEQAGITHSTDAQEVEDVVRLMAPFLPAGIPVLINPVTPALGVHVGPGAVCISCIAAQPLDLSSQSRLAEIATRIKSFAKS
jgi:DegV family protein with EDD domain